MHRFSRLRYRTNTELLYRAPRRSASSQRHPQPEPLLAILDEGCVLGFLCDRFAIVAHARDDSFRVQRDERELVLAIHVSEILCLLFGGLLYRTEEAQVDSGIAKPLMEALQRRYVVGLDNPLGCLLLNRGLIRATPPASQEADSCNCLSRSLISSRSFAAYSNLRSSAATSISASRSAIRFRNSSGSCGASRAAPFLSVL
jgi:hypothetical protein